MYNKRSLGKRGFPSFLSVHERMGIRAGTERKLRLDSLKGLPATCVVRFGFVVFLDGRAFMPVRQTGAPAIQVSLFLVL